MRQAKAARDAATEAEHLRGQAEGRQESAEALVRGPPLSRPPGPPVHAPLLYYGDIAADEQGIAAGVFMWRVGARRLRSAVRAGRVGSGVCGACGPSPARLTRPGRVGRGQAEHQEEVAEDRLEALQAAIADR